MGENELDCGFTNLPFLTRCCNLERLATPGVFLVFLSLIGFLQGVTLTYFRETATIWGAHYNIPRQHIEWLIYTNEFFVGVVGLAVSYYGNKIHRISWIGGLTMFQAITYATLVVPEIFRKNYMEQTNFNLCSKTSDTEINYIAVVILIVSQIFFSMASVSFISHGITYLDDNTSHGTSPGYIGIALACRELGRQAGMYLSWIPMFLKTKMIFVSPEWLSLSGAVFLSGALIAMFPRSMPSTLIKILSASIVDLASGVEDVRPIQVMDGFFKTLWRLLKNWILMINIASAMLLQSALINLNMFQKHIYQLRFGISYLTDATDTQLATNILKQPLVAVSLIATGMVVAKNRLQVKSLVKWNIIVLIVGMGFFGSTAFLNCKPETTYYGVSSNSKCPYGCQLDQFQPVCKMATQRLYYSPCSAGCTSYNPAAKIYKYTCYDGNAIEGSCNKTTQCDQYYSLYQANSVLTSALFAPTLVTNLIINMRCVLSKDKATALGLEATFTGLVPYLPIKAIYGVIADQFCEGKDCKMYTKTLVTFLSISTLAVMALSLLLAIILLIILKFRPPKDKDEDSSIELEDRASHPSADSRLMDDSRDEPDARRNQSTANSISDSLLEMENVGDDHDSIESASYLDEPHSRVNRRIIESNL